MANEITVSGQLRVVKSSVNISKNFPIASFRADFSGNAYVNTTQSIPTTAAGTVVAIPATITTLGFAEFKNLDSTNFLSIGIQHSGTTFVAFLKLKPGESSGPMRLAMANNALYAVADTGACILEYTVLED